MKVGGRQSEEGKGKAMENEELGEGVEGGGRKSVNSGLTMSMK